MMVALALVEGSAIFFALCAAGLSGMWSVSNRPGANLGVVVAAVGLSLVGVGALYFHDAYEPRVVPRFGSFASRVPRCLATVGVLLAPLGAMAPHARVPVAITIAAMLGLVPLLRAIGYAVLRSRRVARRILIVGTSPLALRLADELTTRAFWCRIVGLVDGPRPSGVTPWPVLGPLERLDAIIADVRPHRIITALGERRGQLPVGPLLEARLGGVAVEDGVQVYEQLTGKLAIEWLTASPLIFSGGFRRAPVSLAMARGLSLVASAVGLVIFAPLLGFIAALIRLESPGPIFFVQERVGQGGRRFNLIKFRTMHPSGAGRSEWVRDNQDRITRVGRWLRKFRLDELPQFVNILRGDMNLVGPRPHPVSNFALFVTVLRNCPEWCEQIPYYSLRLMIRPGLTGWAQVRYRYANDLEEEVEKTCYDLYYIKHLSFWLDLRILLDTVKTVLAGHEAGDAEQPARQDRRPQGGSGGAAAAVRRAPDERLTGRHDDRVRRQVSGAQQGHHAAGA